MFSNAKIGLLVLVFFLSGCGGLTQLNNPRDKTIYLGGLYSSQGQHQKAINTYKKAIQINPDNASVHFALGSLLNELGRYEEAIASHKEAVRVKPDDLYAHKQMAFAYRKLGREEDAISEDKKIRAIDPSLHPNRNWRSTARLLPKEEEQKQRGADRLARERLLLEEERGEFEKRLQFLKSLRDKKLIDDDAYKHKKKELKKLFRIDEEERQQQQAQAEKEPPSRKEQTPQSGTGSGFFVSKLGHVITNAHVVQNCKSLTVGDSANKQVTAEVVNSDKSNDLALLKLSSLEMTSANSKSLIQKLSIVVVPLASKGLLRSADVRLGEKILVAGYPFGDAFSNSIKVTTGVVSSTRGVGDDSGQFQLDAAVQPGNSGGPIYDSSGNIVGVVISQLNKKTFGSLVENVNFGIKASTVRQFLISSGLSSKKAAQTEKKSTEQLAEIAKNQALMVMCHQ